MNRRERRELKKSIMGIFAAVKGISSLDVFIEEFAGCPRSTDDS
jgi:hypothetical protein